MFPNVEKVISDNLMFASGNMLVKHHILLNAFYQTDDAVIDLKDVFLIKDLPSMDAGQKSLLIQRISKSAVRKLLSARLC